MRMVYYIYYKLLIMLNVIRRLLMSRYMEDNIRFFQKKYSMEEVVKLYEDNRLIFVDSSSEVYTSIYYSNRTTQLIEAIDMGMPLPEIYVSEQQNGDMVVLDKEEKLYSLISYIIGHSTINIHNGYYENMYDFEKMQQNYPVLASKILRTKVSIEVIDYNTPKYLHMFAGDYVYNWTDGQEYTIRKELYKNYNIDELKKIDGFLYDNRIKRSINLTEYEILQIAAIWGIYNHEIKVDVSRKAQEQMLIEETIFKMYEDRQYVSRYAERLFEIVHNNIFSALLSENHYILAISASGTKSKRRAIVTGLCMCDDHDCSRLRKCMENNEFIRDLRYSEITYENVDRWLSYMYK